MFKHLTEYWNQKIDKALAKHGKIDVQVDADWKMKIVEGRGIVIDPKLISPATSTEARRMLNCTIFTITAGAS